MFSRGFVGALFVALAAAAVLVAQSLPPSSFLTLRIIVVGTRDEADRVRENLARGAEFAALARRESIDPSAADGGLLGRLDVATLRAEVRDALQGVGTGQVTTVVPVATGFAILQVVPETGSTPSAINPASLAAISAVGSVKYVPDIGGLPEAEAVLRDFPKATDWNRDPRSICQARQDSLSVGVQVFDEFFAREARAPRADRPPFELMQAHLGLAQLLAYQGLMARAVQNYERAYALALSGVPRVLPQVEEMLGVAYLHKAGIDNGVFRRPDDLCLLPPRPGRAYAKTDDLMKAAEQFRKYLERRPGDVEVRWLLNLAHMALGTWPDGVPPADRVPPSAFASAVDVGRFPDVAPLAGLNVFASAGGVIVDDLTGSGRFDVVTSNFFSCGPVHYFGNNADGTFTERTVAAGLRDQVGGLNLVQGDYDNDRCTDVLVMRGGWEVAQRRSLLRNDCRGNFSDVTVAAGLDLPTSSQASTWVDINNDGWLDLFVGNEDTHAQLFLNTGKGRFEEISASAGVNRRSFAKGVAAGDYDNDGFADLYVSNYDGLNFLYHNNHDNTFTEVAAAAGVPGVGRGFPTWFFDYDNDGWLDLFVASYFMSVDDGARTYLKLPHNAPTLKLYRNRGNGTFEDVTAAVGLDKVYMPMGSNFGDIDNDGFLDMYLGMGSPSYASLLPHVLLKNEGGRTFVDVTQSSGTGEIHKGHGIAFADLDGDGDQDILAEIGGATPGDSHAMRVFENPGHGNDWVAVKLTGEKSNRSAIGARITVTVQNEGGGRRTIHRQVSSGGSFGASPLEQHIGLGRSARIVSLEIWWPASNTRQRFADVPTNQVIAITEFATSFTPVDRQRVRLGGAKRTP
jgi:tetratricopeptide (TPR) repeat protein